MGQGCQGKLGRGLQSVVVVVETVLVRRILPEFGTVGLIH